MLSCRIAALCLSLAFHALTGREAGAQQLSVQGRVEAADQIGQTFLAPLTLSWAATTVSVSFSNATSVTITILSLPDGEASLGFADFEVDIDGRQAGEIFVSPHDLEVEWRQDELSPVAHSLSLVKLTDARYGRVLLQNITLSEGGT